MSVDGREDIPLAVGDVVEVRAIERPVRLVEPEGSLPFWDLVRRKVELLPRHDARRERPATARGGCWSSPCATSR